MFSIRIINLCFHLGYSCGPVQPEKILSTRKTVTTELKSSAAIKRDRMKEILLKAASERALILSPDIWSDVYRQQSYLGCTAHWVDDLWTLHSFEIFCIPFNTPDKKAPSVRKVRTAEFETDFDKYIFVFYYRYYLKDCQFTILFHI
jgi:hypothetical protein